MLGYRNEQDRCYGATGMAIGLVVYDGEKYLDSLTIDGPADDMLRYTSEYYVTASPRLSAKNSWNQLLRSYNLSMVSVLSNALCRCLVLDGTPVRFEVKQELHDVVCEEGRESCSLEDDELERLFNKNYDYLFRIFSHSGVQGVAHDFAHHLQEQRTLSRLEILEHLRALQML